VKKYYPILVARKGELVALQRLDQDVKEEISPIIEVLADVIEKKVEENKVTKVVYKDEFENFLKTHWSFFNNQVVLDFSYVENLETKINVIRALIVSLVKSGVNVIPAIQENSPASYTDMIKSLILEYRLNACFRTSEQSGGFDNFKATTEWLLKKVEIDPANTILLLDMGEAEKDKINLLGTLAKLSINSLTQKITDWLSIVVASGSFPEDLTEISQRHIAQKIPRHEWTIWNNIIKDENFKAIRYGDFGTKFPIYRDVRQAGTVSIKYTIENEYLIYKGDTTLNNEEGRDQYIAHALKLIGSADYYGQRFSWGDFRIHEIAHETLKDKKKPGSPTTWVQISQNHHITLLHSLL
jgi:hypothetical protein